MPVRRLVVAVAAVTAVAAVADSRLVLSESAQSAILALVADMVSGSPATVVAAAAVLRAATAFVSKVAAVPPDVLRVSLHASYDDSIV